MAQVNEQTDREGLLLVFIHGFKGDDNTFLQFPQRLQSLLTETLSGFDVESVVFPAYETRGDLNETVVRFSDWLITLIVQKEANYGGAGKCKVVLCGHSMGGLLAADSALEFAKGRSSVKGPIWPNVIACIAFDTPYFGLHPYVFKNSVTKAAQYAETAKTVGSALFGSLAGFGAGRAATPGSSNPPAGLLTAPVPEQSGSGWGKWMPAAYAVGGAIVTGAAAGGAYYKRSDLGLSFNWASDHLKYVGNLWDEDACKRRVDALIELDESSGVVFRNFYTFLPALPLVHNLDRTFIIIPKGNPKIQSRFIRAENNIAPDEVQAHTNMFAANTNDGYYNLGLETVRIIREALSARGQDRPAKDQVPEAQASKVAESKPLATDTAQPLIDFNPWK